MSKKLKNRKSITKRFLVKKSKKGITVLKRAEGQDHFNARERGKQSRNKRRDKTVHKTVSQNILKGIPYLS